MIVSFNSKKAYDKIQHPFMILKFSENRNRRKLPELDKEHTKKKKKKPYSYIMLYGERLFPH